MRAPSVSAAEEAEIYETVRREKTLIDKSVRRMMRDLKGLSDVSQKQAIAKLVSQFVLWVYPDNRELALLLSEHMRQQVDIYIHTEMDGEFVH